MPAFPPLYQVTAKLAGSGALPARLSRAGSRLMIFPPPPPTCFWFFSLTCQSKAPTRDDGAGFSSSVPGHGQARGVPHAPSALELGRLQLRGVFFFFPPPFRVVYSSSRGRAEPRRRRTVPVFPTPSQTTTKHARSGALTGKTHRTHKENAEEEQALQI